MPIFVTPAGITTSPVRLQLKNAYLPLYHGVNRMEFFSTAQPRNSAVTRLQPHRVSSPNPAGLTTQPHSVSPLRLQCSGAKHCSLTPGTVQTCSQNTIGLQSNPCRVRGGITAIFIDGRLRQSNQRVCQQVLCLAQSEHNADNQSGLSLPCPVSHRPPSSVIILQKNCSEQLRTKKASPQGSLSDTQQSDYLSP